MYDSGYRKDPIDETISLDLFERRRGIERRKKHGCGFTYISTVGWISRREHFRRKDDSEVFPSTPGFTDRR
jgi:hypothetical protein